MEKFSRHGENKVSALASLIGCTVWSSIRRAPCTQPTHTANGSRNLFRRAPRRIESLSRRERVPEGRERARPTAFVSNPHPALRAALSQRERGYPQTRVIVQYTPIAAIAIDAGTTIRR